MANWKLVRLGDHAQVRARIGWRGLSSDEYTDSGPFLVAGKHIASGSVDWNGCDHITEHRYQESPEISLRKGDVIISKDGTIGRVARIDTLPGPATLNGTMMLVRPTKCLEYRYLAHLLGGSNFKKLVEERISGSSVPHLFQRDLISLAISLPPPAEQRRIAEILDAIDEAIRATERVIAKQRDLRYGLVQELINDRCEHTDVEPRSHSAPTSSSDTRIYCRLSEVATSIVDGPFGSGLKTAHYVPIGGTRVVRLANVGMGRYLHKDEAFVATEYAAVLNRHEIRSGDIVVASLGDEHNRLGRACLYPANFEPGIVKADCFRIRPSGLVDARYLVELLNSDRSMAQVQRLAQGVTRDRVNLDQYRQIIVQIPPVEEQRRVAAIFEAVDVTIEEAEWQLDKLQKLRSGLSDDLLSGRVRTVSA